MVNSWCDVGAYIRGGTKISLSTIVYWGGVGGIGISSCLCTNCDLDVLVDGYDIMWVMCDDN